MSFSRVALSAIVSAAILTAASTVAVAQQEETSAFDLVIEAEAVEVEHAHESDEMHGDHATPLTVRNAPEEASATLENITWEVLSRMAAQIFSGNRATLLSGNEPEVLSGNQTNLASGNELEVLSGNHVSLFSNIQIDIHISGVPNPAEMMSGRREIRVETRTMPQPENRVRREPSVRRDPPRDVPRDQPSFEVRPGDASRPAESPRDE